MYRPHSAKILSIAVYIGRLQLLVQALNGFLIIQLDLTRCVGWCVARGDRWAFGVLALCVYTIMSTHRIIIIKVQMYLVVTRDIHDQFLESTR